MALYVCKSEPFQSFLIQVFDVSDDCCKAARKARGFCKLRLIPVAIRQQQFEAFWNLGNYDLQNAHLFGLIDSSQVKRYSNFELLCTQRLFLNSHDVM
jgi:hypothetical protein